jgi:hypothetical protein
MEGYQMEPTSSVRFMELSEVEGLYDQVTRNLSGDDLVAIAANNRAVIESSDKCRRARELYERIEAIKNSPKDQSPADIHGY